MRMIISESCKSLLDQSVSRPVCYTEQIRSRYGDGTKFKLERLENIVSSGNRWLKVLCTRFAACDLLIILLSESSFIQVVVT